MNEDPHVRFRYCDTLRHDRDAFAGRRLDLDQGHPGIVFAHPFQAAGKIPALEHVQIDGEVHKLRDKRGREHDIRHANIDRERQVFCDNGNLHGLLHKDFDMIPVCGIDFHELAHDAALGKINEGVEVDAVEDVRPADVQAGAIARLDNL